MEETDFDVLIIGAGVSGIDAAYHLKTLRANTTFAVLEGKDEIGGTWNQFRYPGVRSDSDMPTYGFSFKPWASRRRLADGESILDYLREAIAENGIDQHIRFGYRVLAAEFSTASGRWTVTARRGADNEIETFTARFIYSGTGYFNHENGYTPEFDGMGDFGGQLIHPQHWPQNLDCTGKKVVVIGSGATAVTLIPAMAPTAGHITMLQRSPGYIFSLPAEDRTAGVLNRLIGPKRAYRIIRRKNLLIYRGLYKLTRRWPKLSSKALIAGVRRQLPKNYDVATHFTPSYNPWDERMCLVPGNDLFKAISAGTASVVTDRIQRVTRTGIALQSGKHLDADVIVTATGLNMLAFGAIDFRVDGQPVHLPDTTAYRSMMVTGLPNLVYGFGYTNASWTLKIDLVCEHFCRLLDYLDAHGYSTFVPVLDDPAVRRTPFIVEFNPGYMQRGLPAFPRAGDSGPWTTDQHYEKDVERLRNGPVDGPGLRFTANRPAVLTS
ncbi:MAG TPA: NAD(P)/FAD-dependent oxidoreductase [Mycobacterium sp.]